MKRTETSASSTGLGPVFVTGLAGSGKTELRRVLDHVSGLDMARKGTTWARLTRRRDVEAALWQASSTDGRWGIQRKGLERWVDVLFHHEPEARVVHLVRDPAALVSPRRGGANGRALARWANSTARGLRNAARFPGRYLVIRVEDLAKDPSSPRLAEFLSVEALPARRDINWEKFRVVEDRVDPLVDRVRGLYAPLGYASSEWSNVRRVQSLDLIAYGSMRAAGRIAELLVDR